MTTRSTPDVRPPPEGPARDPAQVCTLPPDEFADRMAWVQREIAPHSIETVRLHKGLAFELNSVPGLTARLDQLIERERECCSDLVFERVASTTPGRLRLEVRGVDPDAAVFRALRVPAAPASVPPRGSRLAKAAGTGALVSFVVCCVLPVAAVALLGAAATPLTGLDSPWALATGALIAGGATWAWLGRRHDRSEAAEETTVDAKSCGPGC